MRLQHSLVLQYDCCVCSQKDESIVSFLSVALNLYCLVVCSGEKENSLKTDDYGRDLSSVQTLLTKQVLCSSM